MVLNCGLRVFGARIRDANKDFYGAGVASDHKNRPPGHGGIVMKNEWLKAIILFIMLYAVLAFGDFGTGFQYVGF